MSFTGLLNQTITIEPFTGQDGYGAPTFGPAQTFKARVVSLPKRILGDQGEEITSNTQVYVDTTGIVSPKDRLTLPPEYTPNQPPILRVGPVRGASATHHTCIYV